MDINASLRRAFTVGQDHPEWQKALLNQLDQLIAPVIQQPNGRRSPAPATRPV
jgi:hypothetical protein